jgi:hypothetical protein
MQTSDEKPCLIGCEAMATRPVPSEGVLSLFYPVFNLSPTIVDPEQLVFSCPDGPSFSPTMAKAS